MTKEEFKTHYAFAIGYFDGFTHGFANNLEHVEESGRHFYNIGYDRGVDDYCDDSEDLIA